MQCGGVWQAGEKRVTKIVFIRKKLDRKELEGSFRACLSPIA